MKFKLCYFKQRVIVGEMIVKSPWRLWLRTFVAMLRQAWTWACNALRTQGVLRISKPRISELKFLGSSLYLGIPPFKQSQLCFGTGLTGTYPNGHQVLQGNIHFGTARLKTILELLARQKLGTCWAKYPFSRCHQAATSLIGTWQTEFSPRIQRYRRSYNII